MAINKRLGGARAGAGGTVSTIKISKRHAHNLRALLKARPGGTYGQAEVGRWVEAQIDAAINALDSDLQRAEEKAWEGDIL